MEYREFVKEITFKKAEDLLKELSITGKYKELFNRNEKYIFRGEDSVKYELLPNILREHNLKKLLGNMFKNRDTKEHDIILKEVQIIIQFYKEANKNGLKLPDSLILKNFLSSENPLSLIKAQKWIPEDLIESYVLAQHYGVPTRLLDWSTDPYVALYFAASNGIKKSTKNDYLVLWVLNKAVLQALEQTDEMNSKTPAIPLKFVKTPYYLNKNLHAQNGVLTYVKTQFHANVLTAERLSGIDSKIGYYNPIPLDLIIYEDFKEISKEELAFKDEIFYKFKLPISEAKNLMKYLHNLNYSAAKIFPGYEGVKKILEELEIIK